MAYARFLGSAGLPPNRSVAAAWARLALVGVGSSYSGRIFPEILCARASPGKEEAMS